MIEELSLIGRPAREHLRQTLENAQARLRNFLEAGMAQNMAAWKAVMNVRTARLGWQDRGLNERMNLFRVNLFFHILSSSFSGELSTGIFLISFLSQTFSSSTVLYRGYSRDGKLCERFNLVLLTYPLLKAGATRFLSSPKSNIVYYLKNS